MLGTSLIHALFARDIRPIASASESLHRFWEAEGPLTAFEAYDLAERLAMRIDVDAVCTSIASERPVGPDGRTLAWRLCFHLPMRRGEASYRILTLTWDEDDEPRTGVEVEEAITPLSPALAAREPQALPIPFRDSPEAMRHAMAQSPAIDPRSASLAMHSSVDEAGRFVWLIDGLPVEGEPAIPLAA